MSLFPASSCSRPSVCWPDSRLNWYLFCFICELIMPDDQRLQNVSVPCVDLWVRTTWWLVADSCDESHVRVYPESFTCPRCSPGPWHSSQQPEPRTSTTSVALRYVALRCRAWLQTTATSYIGDSDVISSHQLFSAILWDKLCEMFAILTSVDVTFSIR